MKHNKTIGIAGLSEKAITDIDLSKRTVSGYFAAFGNVDAHDEMFVSGAFSKSIREKGPSSTGNRKIAHLYQHDMREPVGKIVELYEDSFGLKFVSEIIDTQKGNDLLVMYESGVIREHSVGFSYIWDKVEFSEKDNALILREVKLWEGSSVTFGANENTPFLGVKSIDNLSELNSMFESHLRLLKSNASDEALQAAEYNLLLIQKSYIDLCNTLSERADLITQKQEPKIEQINFFNSLLKN